MNGERPGDGQVAADALLQRAVQVFGAGGWRLHLLQEPAEAVELIASLATAAPGGTVIHESSLPPGLALAAELRARGLAVATFGVGSPSVGQPSSAEQAAAEEAAAARSLLCSAGLGVTGAGVLVAETGTLLLAEDDGYGRLVSNLPPVHLAVASRPQLVATLDEGLAAVRAGAQAAGTFPRYLSGISGPSKTGDIDMEIVRGMHGPGEVHLVLLI